MGVPNFTDEEDLELLKIAEEVMPLGADGWDEAGTHKKSTPTEFSRHPHNIIIDPSGGHASQQTNRFSRISKDWRRLQKEMRSAEQC